MYKRHLTYSTDSNDVTVHVYPQELMNNFVQPDQSLQMTVCIEPKTRLYINRLRHIFIESKHPNIVFSIPIIILSKDDNDISMPSDIRLPSTTVENFTYYEMILFNKSANKLQFNVKCAHPDIKIHTKSFNVLKKDYGRILIQFYCQKFEVINDVLKLKFNTGDSANISITHDPLQCSLFVDNLNIDFDSLRFKRKETNDLFICNESPKNVVFHVDFASLPEDTIHDYSQTSVSTTSQIVIKDLRTENIDKFSFRHFEFKPKCATISPNLFYNVKITFRPVIHKDFILSDNDLPPFKIKSSLMISWNDDEKIQKRQIFLKGEIIGPEVEIQPTHVDLRQVYLGEEHCIQINALNVDDACDAHVVLHNVINRDIAVVLAKPSDGILLKPLQSDIFHIKFFCLIIGKFMVKLEFKVKNGGVHSMIIQGQSQIVRVKCYPEIIDFGVIPIAMPQKRLVLLMNPLSVPITVQCSIREDGTEQPLILNARDVKEHLPVTVSDPLYFIKESIKIENESDIDQQLRDFKIRYDGDESETSILSVRSQLEDNNSTCSSEFEKFALDLIPDISYDLVALLKSLKIFDKTELEKKIIEEALNALLKTPYFSDMDKNKNYTQMDWNSLATDPKEIYCNAEIIRLKPNTGKAIAIMVIPNVIGFQNKCVELRVCPLAIPQLNPIYKKSNKAKIVPTSYMTSKLWIEYNCAVPEVIWDNVVIMQDKLYAGEYYDFEMTFENNSNIGGFFYYDVIPCSKLGYMTFPNKEWKYFIEPSSKLSVPCKVKFTKLGSITLAGLIKFLGVYAGYSFHIKSEVLPPKVNFYPQSISKSIEILELMKVYIFIENVTPTTTWFKLKLKDESSMSIEPHGAQLAPTDQAVYITLTAEFKDPGTFKNILYIIMEFETIEKIPITINVKGMPVFFVPEIRNQDLNFGKLLCNTEDEYYADKPNYTTSIKVINRGLRNYRLNITKTKSSSKPSCSVTLIKSKVAITPNNLIICPQSESDFNITINCCEVTTIFSEFRIQLNDLNDVKHTESNRFSIKANAILPQINWNRRDIVMNYYRTHKYQEHDQWETIKLTNVTDNIIDCVNLKVKGPFKIKELFEHKYCNELNFSMRGLEKKEFFIIFNKEMIRNRYDGFYDGTITCQANLRDQKSVSLKVFVFIPSISLKQTQITLFTKNAEGGTFIELTNSGEVPAIYKWKKLKEEWHYISQEDDTQQVASIILSDVIHTLDLETIEPPNSSSNLTLHYQNYKCVLKDFPDPLNVKGIINEIIENLDLTAKRYKLCYKQIPTDTTNMECKLRKTEQILNNLNKYSSDCDIQQQIEDILIMEEEEFPNDFPDKYKEIENYFDSRTVFVNRKYAQTSSATTLLNEVVSNQETCVYHTLDDIIGHLKLDDSYTLTEPSSETCQLRNSVYFFVKCGLLAEKQREMCALHVPAIRKGFEVRATFQLDVVGGKSQQLEIILINLDNIITLSKDNIYLGLKPWYEKFRSKTLVQNNTNYEITVKIQQIFRMQENLPKIVKGYVQTLENKTSLLKAQQSTSISFEGIMGFNGEFEHDFAVNINDSQDVVIKFRGQGLMPMLIMTKPKLPLNTQESFEIIEEYNLLQKIYYFEMFKIFREMEEDQFDGKQEEGADLKKKKNSSDNLSLTISGTDIDSLMEEGRDERFFRLIQTYVLIQNNEDLPSYGILEQQLQTKKFVKQLHYNTESLTILNQLHQNYLTQRNGFEEMKAINLKYFTIEPLPFHTRGYLLDMENVYMNQFRKFSFQIEFLGPGKLLAAARNEIQIPGLMVDFEISKSSNHNDFIYYRNEDNLIQCAKSYRNINERLLDAEYNPKLKHAHSYDIDSLKQHQRNPKMNATKCLRNHYNSLNKSVYKDQKNHIIHCKLFESPKNNFSEIIINVKIIFRPDAIHYRHKQIVEDYLYIDLHMGPTLPILLKAVIIDRNRTNE
ncbi:uncharacterized protein ACRADG_004056 [Cochliomyia hominivorax]